MQATNTVAAFYHLELTKLNSNAQSDLSNTPTVTSSFLTIWSSLQGVKLYLG